MAALTYNWSPNEGLVFLNAAMVVDDTPDYTSGDLVDAKMEFLLEQGTPSDKTLVYPAAWLIQSVGLVDQTKQDMQFDLLLWHTDPAATTFTDNAALDIADADLLNLIGVIPITNYFDFADNSFGQAGASSVFPFPVVLTADNTLWAALVVRDAYNGVAATDLALRIGMLPLGAGL